VSEIEFPRVPAATDEAHARLERGYPWAGGYRRDIWIGSERWVRETYGRLAGSYTDLKDGLEWHQHPRPFPIHQCRPVLMALSDRLGYAQRCACGAIRFSFDGWIEKNSRLLDDIKRKVGLR
jgi:hypothetical protein